MTDTRPQAQRLRDELEEAILNGSRPPGHRVDLDALAVEYQCSRTPVREAVQQLVASGVLTVVPKRGTFVAQLGLGELVEMFEVMGELEGMAGRLAARRIGAAEASELTRAMAGCAEAAGRGDPDRYYYANAEFHQRIYAASHNGFLAHEARQLHARLKPYRRMQLRVRNRIARSCVEHETIVEAILAGDQEAAEHAAKAHVVVQGERFSDFVAAIQSMATPAAPQDASGSPVC